MISSLNPIFFERLKNLQSLSSKANTYSARLSKDLISTRSRSPICLTNLSRNLSRVLRKRTKVEQFVRVKWCLNNRHTNDDPNPNFWLLLSWLNTEILYNFSNDAPYFISCENFWVFSRRLIKKLISSISNLLLANEQKLFLVHALIKISVIILYFHKA